MGAPELKMSGEMTVAEAADYCGISPKTLRNPKTLRKV